MDAALGDHSNLFGSIKPVLGIGQQVWHVSLPFPYVQAGAHATLSHRRPLAVAGDNCTYAEP
jgi:hypothetical protein